ncbi:MAG: glycosyltransferase family 2 protein [Synergistaceae bacterium]|jgi:hypothetical protein|nr:glycosyltransferase family 2 protein [Synergistaceae bacterium]
MHEGKNRTTILTIPREFAGDVGVRQRNAIMSWLAMAPESGPSARPEVIMFGDDAGVGRFAREVGAVHVPEIARTDRGTPLFSDALARGQAMASGDVVAYVNSDIVLFDDFLRGIETVQAQGWSRWLLVGCRQNLDMPGEAIDFADPMWREKLRARAISDGVSNGASGKDYFAFPRGMYADVPPFAIGRSTFDDWMVSFPMLSGFPVVDCTQAVLAVHQNHDYGHISNSDPDWSRAYFIEGHPEVRRNRSIMPFYFCGRIDDAVWEMRDGVIRKRRSAFGVFAHSMRKVAMYLKWLCVYCWAECVLHLTGRHVIDPRKVITQSTDYMPAIRWNARRVMGELQRLAAIPKEKHWRIKNGQ